MGDLQPFQSLFLGGLFHIQNDEPLIQDEGGQNHALGQALLPFVGREVTLVLHYAPSKEGTGWGLGCCKWQPGPCPAGHAVYPKKMVLIKKEGLLTESPLSVGGQPIPLEDFPGHMVRLVVVTCQTPHDPSEVTVENLTSQLQNGLALLRDLQNWLKD